MNALNLDKLNLVAHIRYGAQRKVSMALRLIMTFSSEYIFIQNKPNTLPNTK